MYVHMYKFCIFQLPNFILVPNCAKFSNFYQLFSYLCCNSIFIFVISNGKTTFPFNATAIDYRFRHLLCQQLAVILLKQKLSKLNYSVIQYKVKKHLRKDQSILLLIRNFSHCVNKIYTFSYFKFRHKINESKNKLNLPRELMQCPHKPHAS